MAAVRAWIYDRAFSGLTTNWYHEVLKRLPRGSRLLDVGIGTGASLSRSAALVRERRLHIVGLDIDETYLRRCRRRLAEVGLARHVTAKLESVYDHHEGPYDAVYFSASFMLLPEPVRALRHVARLLAPGGRIYFTQTIHAKKSPVMERLKPLLHRITTIHFGRVTYEEEFVAAIRQAGLQVDEWHTLGRASKLRFCLATAKRPQSRPLEAPAEVPAQRLATG
jgi:ubiquinone/menaquinone biosynthesis C-methylase UbiE